MPCLWNSLPCTFLEFLSCCRLGCCLLEVSTEPGVGRAATASRAGGDGAAEEQDRAAHLPGGNQRNCCHIMDGKQRLTSLLAFMTGSCDIGGEKWKQ